MCFSFFFLIYFILPCYSDCCSRLGSSPRFQTLWAVFVSVLLLLGGHMLALAASRPLASPCLGIRFPLTGARACAVAHIVHLRSAGEQTRLRQGPPPLRRPCLPGWGAHIAAGRGRCVSLQPPDAAPVEAHHSG